MLLNYNTLSSVLYDTYYLSSGEAEKLTPLVAGLFTPNIEFERLDEKAIAAASYVTQVSDSAGATGAVGRTANIGVVDIRGVLNKYNSLCATGMVGYGNMITALEHDPGVDAILLSIDSPGGSVRGTEELGDIISSCKKPTLAFIHDVGGSAAYWLASCTDEIVANNTTAQVGSIGVMTSWADMRGYYAAQGIVLREMYAPESPNKNRESRAAANGDDRLILNNLSVLAQKFQQKVRDNRPLVTDEQLLGATYFAKDVVGTLIDSIGNFDYALNRAATLAVNSQSINNLNNKKMAKPTKPANTYAAMAAAVGVESFESADGSITLSADQAASVEAALATSLGAVGRIPQLQTNLQASQSSVATLTGQLATANARIAELEQEAEAAPGAESASVNPGSDGSAFSTHNDFASALKTAQSFISSQN